MLSRAWGRPVDTIYALSIAQLQESFLIEMDEYPAETPKRIATGVGLPFGPAMVSFLVDSLETLARRSGRVPVKISAKPYSGRSALMIQGPSGEMIELIAPATAATAPERSR